MKLSRRLQPVLFFLAGIAIAFVAIIPLAVTSAIATPDGFLPWFRTTGSPGLGLLVWNTLVVHGLGVGVLALLALLVLYRRPAAPTAWTAACFVAGALAAFHLLMPIVYQTPIALAIGRPWWNYSLELALILAAALAVLIARGSFAKTAS